MQFSGCENIEASHNLRTKKTLQTSLAQHLKQMSSEKIQYLHRWADHRAEMYAVRCVVLTADELMH